MVQLGAQLGLAPDEVVDLPEDKHHVQSLLERLFAYAPTPFGDPGEWALQARLDAQQQLTIQTFQRLIHAAHEQDKVVVLGRGGQMALQGVANVFHVRLIAPLEVRIQRVQQNAGVPADVARARVLQRDQAAAAYVTQFYNVDPADPLLYDLVINTRTITASTAADVIIEALDRRLAASELVSPSAAA